ncbi:hypothetical protein C1E24_10950 [Pseudoalteromonas phenolica]|uniref:Phycocyanin subunit alpha n=1 Tax=Pseudoalteromonas phenolica TaxID=161398 RepID=A0A5R9Q3R8_9GAMM|nr:HEAT repeat domain-containing protein [Pseudoalteromonas phenolica]TLX47007.1 hypothetical protein C1E24_10950 [Pseudoalteromonas phenolica]
MILSCRLNLLAAPLVALASFQSQASAFCQPQFDFNIKSFTSFNYTKLNSPAQQTDIEIQGKLSVISVKKEDEKNWWAVKADQVKTVQGQLSMPLPNYERPFAFKLNEQGLITEFYFADTLDTQSQDQLKGLAYYLQYQKNLSKITNETDTLGEYRVNYKQKENALSFAKVNYEHKNKQALNAFSHIEVEKSEQQITPSECFLDSRDGIEKLNLVGADLTFTSEQSFSVKKLKHPFETALFSMSDDLSLWQSTHVELTQAEKDKLKKELLAFVTEQDITQIDAHTLALLLKKYDAVIGELRGVILTDQVSDNAQMRLFNALGQLDTPSSQLLLSGLLVGTEKQPQTQFRALRALTQGHQPLSQQATDTLLSLLNDGFLSVDQEVSSSFYMTLGILLNNRIGSATAQQLSQAIVEHITLSESESKTADLITALGNSRDDQHVELIEDYLTDSSPRVEKASIRALGMMQSDSAYQNLEKHFNTHSGRNTKALLSALGNYDMKPKTSDSVLNLAVNDNDDSVRYAAINALAKQPNNEGIKETLRQALRSEKSKRNFKAIVKLLHKKPAPKQDNQG